MEHILTRRPWIVWGLRTEFHTHRYIHLGLFKELRRLGTKVYWFDDRPRQDASLPENAILISVGIASKYVPIRSDYSYVLHNVPESLFESCRKTSPSTIRLQVWSTKISTNSEALRTPCTAWDGNLSTLYQPWGTPFPPPTWNSLVPKPRGGREFWVGSVWNNTLSQGNEETIAAWTNSLMRSGVKFTKVPKYFPDKPSWYAKVVRRSAFGATIVGHWQQQQDYVPCRVFKNLSSGIPPAGNAPILATIFGDSAIVSTELEDLIQSLLAESPEERQYRLIEAQKKLIEYTYESGISRISACLALSRDICR